MNIDKYGRMILICSFSAAGIIVLGEKALKSVKGGIFNWITSKALAEDIKDTEQKYKEEILEQEQALSILFNESKGKTEIFLDVDDIYVCKFKTTIKAKRYASKYKDHVVTLYNIDGLNFVYVIDETTAKKAKFFSGIIVLAEEKEKAINRAFKEDSMIFEFDNREIAKFFLKKADIKRFVLWKDHILVDASDQNKGKHTGLRKLAKECFGSEIIDSYTVDKVKAALSESKEKDSV